MSAMGTRIEGPTPAGGAYAIGYWFDATGTEVDDANNAAYGHVLEYDEAGQVVGRTYMGGIIDDPVQAEAVNTGPAVPGGEGNDPWSSMHGAFEWDVWTAGGGKRVESIGELIDALQIKTMEELKAWALTAMELPMWLNMPESLRSELSGVVGQV